MSKKEKIFDIVCYTGLAIIGIGIGMLFYIHEKNWNEYEKTHYSYIPNPEIQDRIAHEQAYKEYEERETIAEEETTTAEVETETTQIVEISADERIFTNYEVQLLERVVMSEAGGESIKMQQAVCECIINRVYMEGYPDTVEGVIYQPNQFSTHNNGTPTEEVKASVQRAINTPVYPNNMVYFRESYYFNFGIPYINIDNMYFSLKEV